MQLRPGHFARPGQKPSPLRARRARNGSSASAESLGVRAELITRDDYARIAEFDALFIRETTAVNHPTYRFASRSAERGPGRHRRSGVDRSLHQQGCSAELLEPARHPHAQDGRSSIATMRSTTALRSWGSRCVLKRPDSSFSRGVVEVATPAELHEQLEQPLRGFRPASSRRNFLPTTFDWRIGILNRKPIFACKYFMAADHWQIVRHGRQQGRPLWKVQLRRFRSSWHRGRR